MRLSSEQKKMKEKISEMDYEEVPIDLEKYIILLCITTVLHKIALFIFFIFLVAVVIWCNKITIFLVIVQFLFCCVFYKIKNAVTKRTTNKFLEEE